MKKMWEELSPEEQKTWNDFALSLSSEHQAKLGRLKYLLDEGLMVMQDGKPTVSAEKAFYWESTHGIPHELFSEIVISFFESGKRLALDAHAN